MQTQQKNIDLANNIQMPMVGFGTYLIQDEDAQSLVHQAIRAGYRHVDTAEGYGNEKGVGLGIKAALAELGISREEIFVTTKLYPGNEAWGQTPKTYESTIESLQASLARLQLNYVDLYLIHAPFAKTERLNQWKALIELQRQGKVRAIGVSNFNEAHIEEIKAAGLPLPDANQIELHPWSQKPELVSYLTQNDIAIIAYSSLVPLSSWRTVAGQDSAKTEQMKADGVDSNSPFKVMAQKYGVSEAQLLLRWGVQKGYAVLPKSANADRIRQNIELFGFEIDEQDMEAIAQMDRGEGVAWSSGDPTKEV
ncbi:aldo/keto reductase [Candidatus Leptofilum sp.]|uniref:aldo/keto reductase n=1 Tax=Candidatus Leptofilum sp. TaxID=3241576 RepID=UPI003B5C7C33